MLLKPRLGMRMCSGIWPPSKPLMATPERAFWPLTPRPAVLPEPEPMPRPRRFLECVAPSLSRRSLSFIFFLLRFRSGLVHDADEVLDGGDHAAHGRGVFQRAPLVHLVQAEADQRRALLFRPADRRTDLLDGDGLGSFLGHGQNPWSASTILRSQRQCRGGPEGSNT